MRQMKPFEEIRYDKPSERVARITLARPEKHNGQTTKMLYEINDALDLAMDDDQVHAVVIAADGKNFSSGHDLNDLSKIGDLRPPIMGFGGYAYSGPQGYMAKEQEIYLGFCWRWRNLPKPIIVQVQGKAIAGGLMLIWPFDIIVASEDAEFSDAVVALGMNGHDEVLLDDSVRYAEQVERAGGNADLHVWEGMLHVFTSNVAALDAARQATEGIGSFLAAHLK